MKTKFNIYRFKENLSFILSFSSFISLLLYFTSTSGFYSPLEKTVMTTGGPVTLSNAGWFGLLAIILISVAIYFMKDKIKMKGTNLVLLIAAVDLAFIAMIAFMVNSLIWVFCLIFVIILLYLLFDRKKETLNIIRINNVKGRVKKRLFGLLFFGVGASFLMVMASDIRDYIITYGIWGKILLVVVGVILISIGAVFFVKEDWELNQF